MSLTSVRRLAAICVVAVAILFAAAPLASANPIYTADNGVAGDTIGFDAGSNALAGNYFSTLPGFNLITSISVFWSQIPVATMTLGIVNDPNGDRNLSDGVVTRSFNVTPTAGDVGHFVTYAFAPTLVSSGFFVAAYIGVGPDDLFPIPSDTSGANHGSRGIEDIGSFLTLAREALVFPDNTWLIRADAQAPLAAIPEPSTLVLALMGLGGARMVRRFTR